MNKVKVYDKNINDPKRFWVYVVLTIVGLAITGVSVVDGNRVTTWLVGILTVLFALGLIGETYK